MKKTKIKSTNQFNKNNEINPTFLGEIDHSVLMYDKENIDNISSNLTSDYTEKNALLSNEIFTEINSLSSSHNNDFNKLSNLIEKNINFIQAISVDLSDDISNIVEFNNKISTVNKSLDELSDLHNLEIETLEKDISTLNDNFETFENELSDKVPEYETDPIFTEWKDECSAVIIGKDAKIDDADAGIAIGLNTSSYLNSIAIGKNTSAYGISRIAVGANARSVSYKGLAIGNSSYATENAIALGFDAKVQDVVENGIKKSNNSIAIGQDAKVIGANNAVQIGSGLNTTDGTLQFRDYPLVDTEGKIIEERIPDKIIKIIDDLSDITDLNDGPGIINFLSEKIDTDIANLSTEFNSEIASVKAENSASIYEIYDEINDLSGNVSHNIENLYNDLSDEIQTVNDVIDDLSDTLSNEVFILNSKIDNLSNEFNLEITSIKADNILSICEIYDEINNLSGSVTQDIENLYNDLSNEIQGVNDVIDNLSDTLSNEVFILNSKIDNLSNNLENSINDVINNRITDEIQSENTGLVTSDTIYKAISKKFIQTEISSDSEINLIPNAFHSVITTDSTIKPLLKLPFGNFDESEDIILKSGDEITVALRSENGSGAQFELKTSDQNKTLIYTDNGLLNNSTNEKGSMLVKAEYDGTFWFLHTHKYTRLVDGVITIILNGSNQITTSHLYGKREQFTVNANPSDGSFSFTINNTIIDQEWLSLFGNGKCQLLKWVTNINDSSINPTQETSQTFTWNSSDRNSVIYLYPIYKVETVDITDVEVSKGKFIAGSVGTTPDAYGTLNFNTILYNYGCTKLPKNIPFKAEITGTINSSNNDLAILYGCFYNPDGDTKLEFIRRATEGSRSETHYLADNSSDDNKRILNLYAWSKDDVEASYKLVVTRVKIGYNRYNKPAYNTFITW